MAQNPSKPVSSRLLGSGSIQPLCRPIPPEAPSLSGEDSHQVEDSWQEEDLDHSSNWLNPDEEPFSTPRFDLPSPTQLETRGVTSQKTDHLFRARNSGTQSEFWSSHTIQKNSVAAKLRLMGDTIRASTLESCHSTWTIATCGDCGRVQHFPNRCDSFFCPECQPRLAHERDDSISWWAAEITEPKFVTLTCRNVPDLATEHIVEFKGWWTMLRRRKFARNWRGGFYSLEVTNRGNGWHLHLHALVDAQWIDAGQLAREWCDITAGAGEIVKVKDARSKEYLDRVKSYIVKPETLASWTPEQIHTFVEAFDKVRTFGVFGSLYGKRTAFREWLNAMKEAKPRCPCGSCNVTYQSEIDATMADLRPHETRSPRPPPTSPVNDLFNSIGFAAMHQPK